MAPGKTALNYSPSLVHNHLMDTIKPSMAYDGGDVRAWQRKLRRKMRELIGDMPEKRTPLNVRTLWEKKHKLGTIAKIVYTSERYADVPAYVCIPKNVEPPYKFMICLQGHSTGMHNSIAVKLGDESKKIKVAGDRDFGLGCMERGIAALCIEQRSFGERNEKIQKMASPHMCHDAAAHALKLGRTLAGERVWDVERGIDYLNSRGDVDMKSIGVMGNSGGGTVTLYACAVLDRLKVAMPSCSFCTFRGSIMSIYHCIDNYIPGLFKYAEMADVMGLFAPKPVVVVAGKDDDIFPIKAVRKAFRDLKKIYTAAGAADHCHLVVGNEGHRFYAQPAWKKMLAEYNRIK